jgi:RNase adaptor protein for sRNA GlmZ degradation
VKLVIVSGLSGSGKTVALHTLEDTGYYCIDNLPVGMLPELVDKLINSSPQFRQVMHPSIITTAVVLHFPHS